MALTQPRPTASSSLAVRREESLARMGLLVPLPFRRRDERLGAWYRRCAAVWLEHAAHLDPEHEDVVRRLARLNPPRPGAGTPS